MVPIHPYYLGATPSAPMNSPAFHRPQSMSQANLPSPGTPSSKAANRQSMPPPARNTAASPPSASASAPRGASTPRIPEATPEEGAEASSDEDEDVGGAGRARKGTMSKNFKFPPASPPPPLPDIPPSVPTDAHRPASPRAPAHAPSDTEEVALTPVIAQSVEMPPPPPVEKERSPIAPDLADEDVGDTEEISLN